MMSKSNIITGLDISSSKISAVMLELSGSGRSTIIAHESQPSRGVNKGALTDIAEASRSVANTLGRLREKTGRQPDNIYANISGDTIRGEKSKGMIPLSLRGREVTNSDITRCMNAASTIRLAFDREVIHKIVLNFSIDDQPSIKSAMGLYASRLYCEMYVITVNLNHVQNIYKCVNDAGFDLKEVVYSGIADGLSVLEDTQKDEGVMLLSMGSSLTEISVFSGGVLTHLDVVTCGAKDIKGAIKESAEFNSITSRIKSAAEDLAKKGQIIKSVVMTGSFTFLEGVADELEECLALPVKMGIVKSIHGNISGVESLRAVTAIGLARYGSIEYQPKAVQAKKFVRNISDKVVEIFNNYF
jgi:cell division protein FtsA